MKKKRFKSALALIATLTLFLTACGQSGTQTSKSGNVKISGVNEFPIVEEPVTLSIFGGKSAVVEDFATNEFTQWYEEKTGVKIKWDLVSGDARQALNLQIASDDYSDIIYNFSLARSEQAAYYNQGVIIDLTELVDEHGYYIKKMLADDPDYEKQLKHTDNKILGIPTIKRDFSAEAPDKMWVYKPWMDKLGAKMPETTDEFYELLKRFKTEDLNGNGKADEVPLAARNARGNSVGIDMYLMNAFTTWTRYGFYNDNGKAVFAPITDEAKEGIRFLRKLYKEGLLHSESFVMNRAQMTSLAENDTPILGAAPGKWSSQFTVAGASSGRVNEYVAIPPLKGPSGRQQTLASGVDAGVTAFHITSDCENPEVAIKWLDWFYSEEGYMKAQAADGLRVAKEGELGLDGKQAKYALDTIENATVGEEVQNKNWLIAAMGYWPMTNYISLCDNTIDRPRQEITYQAYKLYEPYTVKNVGIHDFPVPSELSAAYLEYRTNITNAIDSGFASFIIGEKDIDKDWDAYVQRFYDLGLRDYQKIIQDYLDTI